VKRERKEVGIGKMMRKRSKEGIAMDLLDEGLERKDDKNRERKCSLQGHVVESSLSYLVFCCEYRTGGGGSGANRCDCGANNQLTTLPPPHSCPALSSSLAPNSLYSLSSLAPNSLYSLASNSLYSLWAVSQVFVLFWVLACRPERRKEE
jgi:hypothetical protein